MTQAQTCPRHGSAYLWAFALLFFLSLTAHAADSADSVCPRPQSGSVIAAPAELHSQNGVLEVILHLKTAVDDAGLTRYCYVTDTGLESPTLRVNPGDKLTIHFHNDLPASSGTAMGSMAGMQTAVTDDPCNAMTMSATSSNLHFHGMNVSPTCHQDEVVHTLVQAGSEFDYSVDIPANEPSGMYWYHPHPHGFSEGQTQGGATGAIIVEGIETAAPILAGIPERTLILRDQLLPASTSAANDPNKPAWDLSLNFVPVLYPGYTPAVIQTSPSQQEFWRVSNQAADAIYNLQVVVNGSAIPLQIYAVDGVPVTEGPLTQTSVLMPPGSRMEFVLTTPAIGDKAQLITQAWDTGPDGDVDPARPIANIVSQANAPQLAKLPQIGNTNTATKKPRRFDALAQTTPVVERQLTFSENGTEDNGTVFFITVAGQVPAAFDMNQAPNIVLHQGTVEDWTIQNSAQEDHVFHIHQIHFQVLEVNGVAVTDPALRDTVNIPHWTGTGSYPSVKLRMDFRDSNLVGIFPFHCHILEHEDGGMMGLIQVLPVGIDTSTALSSPVQTASLNSNIQVSAAVTPATQSSTAPTGTMQFQMDSGASMWQLPVTNGSSVLTTSFTNTGTHTFTATYLGDTNYTASQSSPISVTVPTRNFSLNAASSILINGAGNSGSTTISVTPMGGFTDPVALTCQLPTNMTGASCSFAPPSITGSGTATLTVSTTATKSAAVTPSFRPTPLLAAIPLGILCLTLIVPVPRLRRAFYCGLSLLLLAPGCGSGSSSTPPPPSGSATPAGSYIVTVVGASGSGATVLTNQVQVGVQIH